jgi:hypothetical protein
MNAIQPTSFFVVLALYEQLNLPGVTELHRAL